MGFLFGGDSASTTKNTSNDARVVGGDASTNTSTVVSGDGNTLNLSDYGAVSGSLKLAMAGVQQANDNAKASVQMSTGLVSDALGMQSKQQAAFTSALENVKTSDVRILIFAALAVVGLAYFRTKGHA